MKNDYVIIFVTCGSKKEANDIANSLLKKSLVACVNIVSGVESKFWWKGKIDNAKEVILTMKTLERNFRTVEKEVKRLHSYEVPEIIAISVVAGSERYLDWVKESVIR